MAAGTRRASSILLALLLVSLTPVLSHANPAQHPRYFRLTVRTHRSGSVTSSPGGLDCGSTCSTSFRKGTFVVLTANPGGYWDGSHCQGLTTVCTLTMDANKSVEVYFPRKPCPCPTPKGQPDASIRREGAGASVGAGKYSSTGKGETVLADGKPGSSVGFLVKIENRGNVTDSFSVSGEATTHPFDVRYLAGPVGHTNITKEVESGAYSLDNIRRSFGDAIRIVVAIAAGAPVGAQTAVVLSTASKFQPVHTDAVRAVVRVPPLSVSAVSHDGVFRCTATFPQPELHPASPTGVAFTVTNESRSTVKVPYATGGLIVRDKGGNKAWNSYFDFGFGPPPPLPQPLRPGETAKIFGFDVPIRWGGPLLITPICHGLKLRLPTLRFDVAVPGQTPAPSDALKASLRATHGLFDNCLPRVDGTPVKGEIDPLLGGHRTPPLSIRCWAQITQQPGFDVVTLYFVSPSSAVKVELPPRLHFFSVFRELPGKKPLEAARWGFIVTPNGVRSYGSDGAYRMANSKRRMKEFDFYKGQWQGYGSGCGGEGEWVSLNGDYFDVPFITMCGTGPAFASRASYSARDATRSAPSRGLWCVAPKRGATVCDRRTA